MSYAATSQADRRIGADASLERRWAPLAIWLGASVIAVLLSLLLYDSAYVAGEFLPRGNDSFYHARRILDAAIGTRGFYQFDERLHVPDGTYVPWPWAYDYLVAELTRLAVAVSPVSPTAFIALLPVAWILVNAALFLAAARQAGLSVEMQLIAMFCFAISPLTQLLHGIGTIDHHYVEHTFVLLTVWLGLRWFNRPDSLARAIALGVVLGVAPAFHTGLFILQLLPLVTAAVLWVRGSAPRSAGLLAFGATLVVSTQLILVPSLPFRDGIFEFGLLSWFHLYIAVATAGACAFMARWAFSRTTLLLLVAIALALLLPLAGQLVEGAGFLSGTFSILDHIMEAQSPYRFAVTFGPRVTASYYSWLVLLAPVLLAFFAYRALRETKPDRLYYAVVVIFGLALLLAQIRLQYFGFFAFVTSILLLVDRLRAHRGVSRAAVFVATLGLVVLAYQPALRERLFLVYPPSGNVDYANTLALYHDLGRLCAEDAGLVLANPEDGNPILYHSECSVIANVFILRPADAEHIAEVQRLWTLPAERLRAERPDVKYVLVRAAVAGGSSDDSLAARLSLGEPPRGFTLVRGLYTEATDQGFKGLYASLYKVTAPGLGDD